MKKKMICLLVLLILLSSVFAQNETIVEKDPCAGFWGKVSCFFFGNPDNRAGRSWFDRGNVVGEASNGVYNPNLKVEITPKAKALMEKEHITIDKTNRQIVFKDPSKNQIYNPNSEEIKSANKNGGNFPTGVYSNDVKIDVTSGGVELQLDIKNTDGTREVIFINPPTGVVFRTVKYVVGKEPVKTNYDDNGKMVLDGTDDEGETLFPVTERSKTEKETIPETKDVKSKASYALETENAIVVYNNDNTVNKKYSYQKTSDNFEGKLIFQTLKEGKKQEEFFVKDSEGQLIRVEKSSTGVWGYKLENGKQLTSDLVNKQKLKIIPDVPSSLLGQVKEINSKTGIITLNSGGFFQTTTQDGIVISELKSSKDSEVKTTFKLPTGETFSSDKWVYDPKVKKITSKDPDNKRSISVSADKIVDQTEDGDKVTVKTTTYKEGIFYKEVAEVIIGTSPDYYTIRYADGTTFQPNIVDGKLQFSGYYYNKEGRRIGTCLNNCDYDKAPDENTNIIWADGVSACIGVKSSCYNPDGTKKPWTSESVIDSGCENGHTASCQASSFINSQGFNDFIHGEGFTYNILTGKTEIQQAIGSILSFRPGWEGLSALILPDVTKKWNKAASDAFDQVMLTQYVVPAAVCKYSDEHIAKKPGENAVFLEVAPGTVQSSASLQAEKTPQAGPVFCSEDVLCSKGECNKDGYCEDKGKPVIATFYKITWAVKSPEDEKFTPYRDENGIAIKYNVQLKDAFGKTVWLYPADEAGDDETLKLKNGASDRDAYAAYSANDYTEACIIFGAPPEDLAGDPITHICADFVESTKAEKEYKESSGAKAVAESATVKDLGRKQI